MRPKGREQCWKSCANGSNIVALRFGDHGRQGMLAQKFDQLQILRNNSRPNNTQKQVTGCANGRNMQHPTMLRVFGPQCCYEITIVPPHLCHSVLVDLSDGS